MLACDENQAGSRHLDSISPADTLLLVIDVQGKLARSMYQAEFMLSNIVNAIKGAQVLGMPVLHIEQYPQGLGRRCRKLRSY